MKRTKITNAEHIERLPIQEEKNRFIKHCRVKNLSPQTIGYYKEDCEYFAARCGKDYIDEVDYEVLEEFIFQELGSAEERHRHTKGTK